MKKLIIAEKPSLARNIASALNVRVNKEGYMENGVYPKSWTNNLKTSFLFVKI